MAAHIPRAETRADTRRFLTVEMRHRYTMLLVFIVIFLAMTPFIAGDELAIYSMRLGLSLILLYGIYAGRGVRRDLVAVTALGIPVLVGRWLPQYSTDIRVFLSIDILTAAFLLYLTIMILNEVLRARSVTLDTIAGAVCAYLLIGLAWAFVYRAMFAINPHSFLFATSSFARIFEDDARLRPLLMHFAYYSFATLTTTGFGDITPASGSARALSVLEAIAGQFFIAVLIARLVSLELIHSSTRRDRE
jgi:voltage-gated potassium channel